MSNSIQAMNAIAQTSTRAGEPVLQHHAEIQNFARFEECRQVILGDHELLLPRSYRRAASLVPLIKTVTVMRLEVPDIRDENGVSITAGRLLESTLSWRAIAERAFMQGAIDANEVQLYDELAEEVCNGEKGPACREVLRKAVETGRSNHHWGSYGWEWVKFMESERGKNTASYHSKSVVSKMVVPFPANIHSLPTEIHLQIMAEVKEESLQDSVSLASTNQYFRRIARRPSASELASFRQKNLDLELWYICVGCHTLLNRRHYNSFENKLVENAILPLCLSCGSRTLRENGDFWPEAECCCSSPDCPGTMRLSAKSLKETTSDGYFYGWCGKECREPPRSYSYYFGPGYRWKDEEGTLWLRCKDCYKDSVDYDTLSTACRPCRKAKPDSAHYKTCYSCGMKLSRRKFSRTRQYGDGNGGRRKVIRRTGRHGHWDEGWCNAICLACGERPLPERYDPESVVDGAYRVHWAQAREHPELEGAGLRYAMGYIWTDNKRRVWKRCDCCRRPAQVKKLNSKGRCKECRRKVRAEVRKFNGSHGERRTNFTWPPRNRPLGRHSRILSGQRMASPSEDGVSSSSDLPSPSAIIEEWSRRSESPFHPDVGSPGSL